MYHQGALGPQLEQVVQEADDVLPGRDAADRAGENVIEQERRHRQPSQPASHGLLDDAIDAAAHEHGAALDVDAAHAVAEEHHAQDEPGRRLADLRLDDPADVIRRAGQVAKHQGRRSPERDEREHHARDDQNLSGRRTLALRSRRADGSRRVGVWGFGEVGESAISGLVPEAASGSANKLMITADLQRGRQGMSTAVRGHLLLEDTKSGQELADLSEKSCAGLSRRCWWRRASRNRGRFPGMLPKAWHSAEAGRIPCGMPRTDLLWQHARIDSLAASLLGFEVRQSGLAEHHLVVAAAGGGKARDSAPSAPSAP